MHYLYLSAYIYHTDLHDLTLQTQVTHHMNTTDINTKDKIMKQQIKQGINPIAIH